jgi:transposase
MKHEEYISPVADVKAPERVRKPGRPRAIPANLESVVTALYSRGYGYRAISNILREEYHINPHYSSVRQVLKRLNLVPAGQYQHREQTIR